MAEPISLASGLLALATFACQSSIALYSTVQSFKVHPKRVRDLEEELKDLSGVLHSLTDTVCATTDIDLSALDLPLLRCGNACKEFEQELLKCSSRSKDGRASFRDWARLRYMGDDIDGFRQLLAGYKSTINIALADANLRKSSVTAEGLQAYRDLIKDATDDLEAHLESIDEKLEAIFARKVTDSDATELGHIKEERLSTQKCLQICAQLSEHIDQIDLRRTGGSQSSFAELEDLPGRVTGEGLQQCKISLDHTTARLERHMQDLVDRWMAKSKTAMTQDEIADFTRLQEEWKTARQCIDICSKADYHLRENISIIDNHASGDETVQFLVSTKDKTIHGKNRGYGFRIRQVGGHLSDESLQQLSRDISRISVQNVRTESPTVQGDTPSDPNDAAEKGSDSCFHERYGPGMTLTSKPDTDTTTTSKPPEEGGPSSSQKRTGGGSRHL